MPTLNATHDPDRRSWIGSANHPDTDFPIQNLPLGVFRRGPDDPPHLGAAIGDQVLDLTLARALPSFSALPSAVRASLGAPAWNACMALDPGAWAALRSCLSDALRVGSPAQSDLAEGAALVPIDRVELLLPCMVGDYTDFYASIHHATNVGSMFRPDNPLLPNYKWVPIGYHGRASSVVASGAPVHRPAGQLFADGADAPAVGPSRMLDYECEVGILIGGENRLGTAVPIGEAGPRLFGLCLVNDWSARDIQKWEYQPLGPFLSKSFLTTLSPWIVTAEALAPFRAPVRSRPAGDPEPLPYLWDAADQRDGALDLAVDVYLQTPRMREAGTAPMRVSRGRFADLYWTVAQLIAHHTSNGCNLRPGDLLASGTISGPEPTNRGCLLERTWRGTEPLALPDGETRRFLDAGDEVVLRARCERRGRVGIGFGECRGTLVD